MTGSTAFSSRRVMTIGATGFFVVRVMVTSTLVSPTSITFLFGLVGQRSFLMVFLVTTGAMRSPPRGRCGHVGLTLEDRARDEHIGPVWAERVCGRNLRRPAC